MLGSNSDNSASIVRTNAERLIGTWRATGGSVLADLGYGGNALSSRIEEWNFADDLTYTYRLEKADQPHVALWFHGPAFLD